MKACQLVSLHSHSLWWWRDFAPLYMQSHFYFLPLGLIDSAGFSLYSLCFSSDPLTFLTCQTNRTPGIFRSVPWDLPMLWLSLLSGQRGTGWTGWPLGKKGGRVAFPWPLPGHATFQSSCPPKPQRKLLHPTTNPAPWLLSSLFLTCDKSLTYKQILKIACWYNIRLLHYYNFLLYGFVREPKQ